MILLLGGRCCFWRADGGRINEPGWEGKNEVEGVGVGEEKEGWLDGWMGPLRCDSGRGLTTQCNGGGL
jgi:hypothetical protein